MTTRQQLIHARVMGIRAGLVLQALNALRGEPAGFSVIIRLPPRRDVQRPAWMRLLEGPMVRCWLEPHGLVYVDHDQDFYTRKGRAAPKARLLVAGVNTYTTSRRRTLG